MSMEAGLNAQYEHFVPEAKLVPDFHLQYEYILVTTLSQLVTILVDPQFCAWDLETSSLNPEEGFIVGVALSMDGRTGYYIPIRHATGGSLGPDALDAIYQYLRECKNTFTFNHRFDARFMEFAGYDMSIVKYFDVSVGANHADSNVKMPSLKWCFTPDTLVKTTRGLIPIVEIKPRSDKAVIGDDTYDIAELLYRGEKRVVKVTFDAGTHWRGLSQRKR